MMKGWTTRMIGEISWMTMRMMMISMGTFNMETAAGMTSRIKSKMCAACMLVCSNVIIYSIVCKYA